MAQRKLKGYVLLESMIAMIVVMLCFGVSMMIHTNVITGSRNTLTVLARIRLENEAIRAKNSERLIDETIAGEAFRIEKTILPWPGSDNLYRLTLVAVTPGGRQLARYDEVIRRP
jgi:hypothetical protein